MANKHNNRKAIHVSRAQLAYLDELINDDLAETDLTDEEHEIASVLAGRTHSVLSNWPEPNRQGGTA